MKLVCPDEILDCFSLRYIELALKRCCDNSVITLYGALKLVHNVVLFEGNPGMGKSTLAINICKQWAEGNLLQYCDAVILLPLRDPEIQAAKSIRDLLLILDDEMRESVFKEIVKSNGKRICFILEGYDELPKKLHTRSSIFVKVKEKLTRCMLVYTSCPEARPYIEVPKSSIISIDGFTNESVDKYISSTFEYVKNGEELAGRLKSQLCNNPVVQSILHVPINLAIVCLIFFHFSTLPETLTGLYTLLCLRLILRHITTRTPNEEQVEKLTSLNDLPKSISEQFFQLCFIACKGIESRTIIFSSQNLLEIGVDEKKVIMNCLGLLQITTTTSVYGREKSYNFLHLTVQEFCAAWYISKLSTEEQMKLLKAYYYDDQFEVIWKFYSGITGLKNRQIINFMLPYKMVKSDLTKVKMIKLMYHIYEAHNDEVCKVVGDHCDGSFADLYPEHLRFFTYSFDNHKVLLQAFSYFLTHYKGILRLVDITTWSITDRELMILVSSLEKRLSLQNDAISDKLILKIPMEHVTHQSYSSLANLLTVQYPITKLHIGSLASLLTMQYPITELYIGKYSFMVTCSALTCEKLLTQGSILSVLDISGIKIGPEQAMCLADCRNIQLHDLRMSMCKLGVEEVDKIGEMLSHNKSITSIDLSNNYIRDEGVERMVRHLKIGNVLQCINLCDNEITAVGIDHLKKLLETNSTLTSLDLSHNYLLYEDIYLFLNTLSIKMEYIGLYGYPNVNRAIATTHAVPKVKSFGFVLDGCEISDN